MEANGTAGLGVRGPGAGLAQPPTASTQQNTKPGRISKRRDIFCESARVGYLCEEWFSINSSIRQGFGLTAFTRSEIRELMALSSWLMASVRAWPAAAAASPSAARAVAN